MSALIVRSVQFGHSLSHVAKRRVLYLSSANENFLQDSWTLTAGVSSYRINYSQEPPLIPVPRTAERTLILWLLQRHSLSSCISCKWFLLLAIERSCLSNWRGNICGRTELAMWQTLSPGRESCIPLIEVSQSASQFPWRVDSYKRWADRQSDV